MDNLSDTMPALLTYDDYCQIPDDGNRYEVVDGVLFMSPSPVFRHQKISQKLTVLLSVSINRCRIYKSRIMEQGKGRHRNIPAAAEV